MPQFVKWRTLIFGSNSNNLLQCVSEMVFPFSTKYRSSFRRGISSWDFVRTEVEYFLRYLQPLRRFFERTPIPGLLRSPMPCLKVLTFQGTFRAGYEGERRLFHDMVGWIETSFRNPFDPPCRLMKLTMSNCLFDREMSKAIFLRILKTVTTIRYLDLQFSKIRFDFLTREQLYERNILQFASPIHTLDVLGNAIPRFNEEVRDQIPPSIQRTNDYLEELHLETMLIENQHLHRIVHLNGNDGARLSNNILNLMTTNRIKYFENTNDVDPYY